MTETAIDFRAIFASLPSNYLLLKPDAPSYTILSISDELLQLSGRNREDVVGRSIFSVYPDNPEAPSLGGVHHLKVSLQKVLSTKKADHLPALRYDFTYASGDFEKRYWSVNNKAVLNAEGEVAYIINSAKDITEQVEAQEKYLAIQEIEKIFHQITQVPVAISIFKGSNFIVEYINPLACEIFGKQKEEMINKLLFEQVPELKEKGYDKILSEVINTGQTFEEKEISIKLSRQGKWEEKFYNLVYQAYRNKEGEITGVIQLQVEVTEQVNSRKILAQMNRELEEVVRLRTKEVQDTREQLEVERNLLQKIFEQAPVAMCLFVGEDLKVVTANDLICKIWGRTANQVLKLPLLEGVPELQGQGFDELLKKVLHSGVPYTGNEVAAQMMRDGELKTTYYNFVYQPLYDQQGNILGVVDIAIEVTELVLARKAVEEREKGLQDLNQHLESKVRERTQQLELARRQAELQWKELHNLFEQSPVAIAVVKGPEYVIDIANQKVCDLWGRTQQEALNTPMFELLPEAADQGFEDLLDQVMASAEPYVATELPSQIKRYGRKETVYWNFVYYPYRDVQQKVRGVSIVATEVTEQVIARKKITESQKALRRFKFMADQAQDSFVLIRRDWTFAYINQKARESWGYTVEEAENLRLSDIEPSFHEESFAKIFEKVQNEHVAPLETWHQKKNGELFPVEVNAVGLEIEGESFVFAVSRDISERKKAEEILKLKNQELIHINNDLDNFIYTASHDLKTPITNIEGLITVLQERLPEAVLEEKGVEQIIRMMDISVTRFKKTISNLSDVVKLQKEQITEQVEVDLEAVVKEVLLDLNSMISQSGAELEVDVSVCTTIHFSEKNLRSVVYNLVSNAIKYHSPDRLPKIHIDCEGNSDYTILNVRDNGIGMKNSNLLQLFSMFKRFHKHVEGTGIGLYMVKKIVENAGGYIEVESQEGDGTTFKVYFPVRR